jgi:membrane protein required for colicin V production
MPFQLLDIILVGIMLISGLLALMRGFTREVLSLIAWGAAAVAAYFAVRSPQLIAYVRQYDFFEQEIVAKIAVGAAAFLIVLIIVSLISVKLSDAVVDSAAGAFDRTLGFLYGLARGLVLVVIAYLFYGWLIPVDRQETWVKNARSLPVIQSVGQMILSLVPPDIAETLTNAAILGNSPNGSTAVTVQPDTDEPAPDEEGYKKSDSQSMDQLIQGTQGQSQQQQQQQQQPSFGGESNPN